MRFSVIIPAYNEPTERIDATLASARQAIVVDGCEHELIVIDDGSAQALTVTACPWTGLFRVEHRGIAGAINEGVRRATGDYVVPLAVGDTVRPERLKALRGFLELQDHPPAVFHDWHDGEQRRAAPPSWRSRLATDNQFSLGAALWRRDLGIELDESLRWCSDWDFAARVQYEGPGWRYLPLILSGCHEHPDGHTASAARDAELGRIRGANRATVAKRWRSKGAT